MKKNVLFSQNVTIIHFISLQQFDLSIYYCLIDNERLGNKKSNLFKEKNLHQLLRDIKARNGAPPLFIISILSCWAFMNCQNVIHLTKKKYKCLTRYKCLHVSIKKCNKLKRFGVNFCDPEKPHKQPPYCQSKWQYQLK